jgi:hypothetical protein
MDRKVGISYDITMFIAFLMFFFNQCIVKATIVKHFVILTSRRENDLLMAFHTSSEKGWMNSESLNSMRKKLVLGERKKLFFILLSLLLICMHRKSGKLLI